MSSYLIAEPFFLGSEKRKDCEENVLERKIILKAVLNRVKEETGKRPEYKENQVIYIYKVIRKYCIFLEYLKRYACYLAIQGRPPATEGIAEPDDARRLIELYKDSFNRGKTLPFNHLVLPSYPAGYYVPLDFYMPVILTREMFIDAFREEYSKINYNVTTNKESIIIASSLKLINELNQLNETLNSIDRVPDSDEPFYAEKIILKELYKAAKSSYEKKLIIVWREKACLAT